MKVLVIGGGFGGLTACTSLRKFDKTVEITMVEPKEYFEVCWAAYRGMMDSTVAEGALFDLKHWALRKAVKLIKATVTSLSTDSATLSTGDVIEFNVCVIATGATTKWPALGRGLPSQANDGSRARRLKVLEAEGKKLLNAESVLVVGGGLIGVETAGDLKWYSKAQGKNLKVTLVNAGEQLVPEFSVRAAAMAKAKLETLGVEVILNEKVVKNGDKLVLQKSRKELDAKEVVWTTGLLPINSFMDRKLLNKRGWIEVDDYFRVKGAQNKLFAIGDCCDLLPNAGNQILNNIGVIGKNIKAVLDSIESGKTLDLEKKMRKVLWNSEVYVATIGKGTGVAVVPGCYTQFFLPWFKNSTMFLSKPKGDLHLAE